VDVAIEDKQLLWSLMPDWVKKPEVGLCPTMYGTGSFKNDCIVHEKVTKLLGIMSVKEIENEHFSKYGSGKTSPFITTRCSRSVGQDRLIVYWHV